jgi:hypothetical protein
MLLFHIPASRAYRLVCLIVGFAIAALSDVAPQVFAQNQLSEPVYRVANDATANPAPATVATTTNVATPAAGSTAEVRVAMDFRRKSEQEHPLVPVIRVCSASLEEIDRNIRDYSCTLVKQERIDGEMGEHQHIFMKILHEPFSVYMSFLQLHQGREVLWVADQNNGEMVVLEGGWKRRVLGKMNLDPKGSVAMKGQRHPITRVGIRNLTAELIRKFEKDTQYGECDVSTRAEKVAGRPCTMVQVVHPIPRKNFHAHVARVCFDNELGIPIHYDAYLWPDQPGGPPPLDESYTYTNLKINNGFTARDFDAYNNPEIFKP